MTVFEKGTRPSDLALPKGAQFESENDYQKIIIQDKDITPQLRSTLLSKGFVEKV